MPAVECFPEGEVWLIMSRCTQSTSALEYDELSDESDADDSDGLEALFAEDNDEDLRDTVIRPATCHFRVSSQCIIIASPVFRAMLQGGFKESLTLKSTGELRLQLPDDDPDSFTILLDILHHHTKKVPRLESVEIFSDMWIDGLQGQKGGVLVSLTPNVLPCIFISWVFQKEKPFRQTTRILQLEGDSTMDGISPEEVYLPSLIIAELQSDRCRALEEIFETIALYIREYQEPTSTPKRLCQRVEDLKALAGDAMVLGTLLKGCAKAGIWPIPAYPYHGFTVRQVVNAIAVFEICSLCEINKDGLHGRYKGNVGKEVHDKVKSSMLSFKTSVEAVMKGLDLDDFV